MPDQTSVDYLGLESPVSIAEKSALPTGAGPLGITTATPTASGGGVLPNAPSAETGSRASGPGVVTTNASGAPGVPGAPVSVGGALEAPLLQKIIEGGGTFASSVKKLLAALDEKNGGSASGSGLDPSKFSLSDQDGGLVLNGGDYSFDLGSLNDIFPQLLKLRGAFGEGGAGLDPSKFDLSGAEGAASLNPSDFSSGVDTTITAPTGDGGSSGVISSALPYAGTLVNAAMGALSGSPAKAVAGAAPGLLAAGGALAGGVSVGDALASAGGGPVLGAFNIPQLANMIQGIVDPLTEQENRRAGRTSDAATLQRGIWAPIFNARTAEDFAGALATPVGGSTAGDALAAVLWNNLSGAWYGDTGHGWLPDLSLLPLLTVLTDMGYTGKTEPKQGNVGGVGEIVMGGGPFYPADKSIEGTRFSSDGTPFGYDLQGGSRQGSIGWDRALRDLTSGVTGNPITAERPFDRDSGYGVAAPVVQGANSEGTPGLYNAPQDMVSPEYLDQLAAFDPAAAAKIRQKLDVLEGNRQAQTQAAAL